MTNTNIGWKDAVNTHKIKWIDNYVVGSKILDLGAGRGWYSKYLSEKGCDVTAIDQEPFFEDEKIKIVVQSLEENLPFKDEEFDTVLACDIIEHVSNEAQLISEIARVLKKGGRVIVSVPHQDDSRIASSYLTYCHYKDKTHCREYLQEELNEKFEKAGMSTVSSSLTGGEGYPYILLCFIDNRFAKFLVKVFIWFLRKIKIISVKNCHGDIFAVFAK